MQLWSRDFKKKKKGEKNKERKRRKDNPETLGSLKQRKTNNNSRASMWYMKNKTFLGHA